MIDVEQQNLAWMLPGKLVENPLLPALRQILFRLEILIEEPLLVRYAEKIENLDDHIEMRKQKDLRKIGGDDVPARSLVSQRNRNRAGASGELG